MSAPCGWYTAGVRLVGGLCKKQSGIFGHGRGGGEQERVAMGSGEDGELLGKHAVILAKNGFGMRWF